MADDENALLSKILLKQAANKSKAQSWLAQSLGKNDSQTSLTEPQQGDDLAEIHGDDELSGIGVVKRKGDEDDISNRQLASANDALRRKLLSTKAYKRFNQAGKNGLDASKPMPKKARVVDADSDSEEESKGRSKLGSRTVHKKSATEGHAGRATESNSIGAAAPVAKGKKRSESYLDQLLAERAKKKRPRVRVEDG